MRRLFFVCLFFVNTQGCRRLLISQQKLEDWLFQSAPRRPAGPQRLLSGAASQQVSRYSTTTFLAEAPPSLRSDFESHTYSLHYFSIGFLINVALLGNGEVRRPFTFWNFPSYTSKRHRKHTPASSCDIRATRPLTSHGNNENTAPSDKPATQIRQYKHIYKCFFVFVPFTP